MKRTGADKPKFVIISIRQGIPPGISNVPVIITKIILQISIFSFSL